MIHYRSDGIHPVLNLCRWRGSAIPVGLKFGLPCAGVASLIKWTMLHTDWWITPAVVANNAVWTGFTVLVGFLVIFRTSQGYARFVEGCSLAHKMRAEWFDTCAGILAFTTQTKGTPPEHIFRFRSLVVRLFSMLHAAALAEIEDTNSHRINDIQAFHFELLDAESIDKTTMDAIRTSSAKPELMYYWINQVVVEGMASGILSVPPPILSRVFQTLANGMVVFHEAVRLSSIPFPFPYAQACDWLLLFHYLLVPAVTAQWVLSIPATAAFAFVQVFSLWTLNGIAQELENPFGSDYNDLDCLGMQREMNQFLELLLAPASLRLPVLVVTSFNDESSDDMESDSRLSLSRASFVDVWGADTSSQWDVTPSGRSYEESSSLSVLGRKSKNVMRSLASLVTNSTTGYAMSAGTSNSGGSHSSVAQHSARHSTSRILLPPSGSTGRESSTIGHAGTVDTRESGNSVAQSSTQHSVPRPRLSPPGSTGKESSTIGHEVSVGTLGTRESGNSVAQSSTQHSLPHIRFSLPLDSTGRECSRRENAIEHDISAAGTLDTRESVFCDAQASDRHSIPLARLSLSSDFNGTEISTTAHAMSGGTQAPKPSSTPLVVASGHDVVCHDAPTVLLAERAHFRPAWHSQAIPSTPPDMEALVPIVE